MLEIVYTKDANIYLDNLVDVLLRKNYFSYEANALQYVLAIRNFIEEKLAVVTKRPAPFYFRRFGYNLQYITYKRNKQTTWYIFFQQKGTRYLIKHITNNHDPKISKKL